MRGQGGFIKAIVIIIIALIVLGYFGYNISDILKNPTVQKNLDWAWNLTKKVWENYLKTPATMLWDKIFGNEEKKTKPTTSAQDSEPITFL